MEPGAVNLDDILDNIDLTSSDLVETRRPVLKVRTNFNKEISHKEEIHWEDGTTEPDFQDIYSMDDSANFID